MCKICDDSDIVFVGVISGTNNALKLTRTSTAFFIQYRCAAADADRWEALLGGKAKRFSVRDVFS